MCLIYFHKMIKTQFEKNIKRIRCDNGGEFTSNQMMNFYAEQGIILETTCPHTPQQNGVVERKHRHLLETARALKFEASLPKRFWGECILTATYIINRLPSKVIGNKTPYELLHGEKPNYDHMRVLGCLAYYRSVETNGDKFEIRGRPGVFMGYPSGTKGYKVFDPSGGKIITSRDVKFAEKVFPFATSIKENQYEENDMFTLFPDEENEPTKPTESNEGQVEEVSLNGPENHLTIGEQMEMEELGQGDPIDSHNGPAHTGPEIQSHSQATNVPEGAESTQQNVNEAQNENNEDVMQIREKRSRTRPVRLNDYDVELPPSIDHAHPDSDQRSSTPCRINIGGTLCKRK
ncbi:putative RNA-directed DNA polymerase [Helianthus annuus]|uniref:RNA-directed DNA polymerase n=2 Tax=Helianthus annuus TaxID=4232 RepID=A0A9K3E5W7_HELAN|nr:putative RNA-directed DNA polymerase [Helianthus annuus]KAJ0838855.1 putative RNA-directed DNA polymerase [Helianthus annuus]